MADSAAEYAWINPDFGSLSEAMNLCIHSWGGFSSPHVSSCAAVAYLDFFDGVVSQSCIVAVRGRLIRVPDAPCAEAEALLLSTELLVEVLKVSRYLQRCLFCEAIGARLAATGWLTVQIVR